METALYLIGAGTSIMGFINAMEKLGETKLAQKARKMFGKMKEKASQFIKKPNDKLKEVENLINEGNRVMKSGLPGQEIIDDELLPC